VRICLRAPEDDSIPIQLLTLALGAREVSSAPSPCLRRQEASPGIAVERGPPAESDRLLFK